MFFYEVQSMVYIHAKLEMVSICGGYKELTVGGLGAILIQLIIKLLWLKILMCRVLDIQ